MNCPRCRAENREGRRFCGECGLSFAATGASCGFLNEGSEKFCGGCGRSLTADPATAEPKFSSPDAYTPKHLAERILTSRAALEGERKHVTVLFADMKRRIRFEVRARNAYFDLKPYVDRYRRVSQAASR